MFHLDSKMCKIISLIDSASIITCTTKNRARKITLMTFKDYRASYDKYYYCCQIIYVDCSGGETISFHGSLMKTAVGNNDLTVLDRCREIKSITNSFIPVNIPTLDTLIHGRVSKQMDMLLSLKPSKTNTKDPNEDARFFDDISQQPYLKPNSVLSPS